MLVLKIERRVRVWTAITAALARSLQAADIPVNRYRRANGGGDGSRNQVQAADGKRGGKDLILTEASPGTILGELALLCGIPRSASARAKEKSTVLKWSDETLRTLLLRDRSLAQRIFRQALRTLIDKERSLIDSLVKAQGA